MHYELIDESWINDAGVRLFRIRATRDIPARFVRAGDLGGWLSSLYTDAGYPRLADDAWVDEQAQIYGHARVSGSARVYGKARVYSHAHITDRARVYGCAQVAGRATVGAHACVYGDARITGDAHVSGHARVYGSSLVADHATVTEHCVVDSCAVKVRAYVGGLSDCFDSTLTGDARVGGVCELSQSYIGSGAVFRGGVRQVYQQRCVDVAVGVDTLQYQLTDTARTLDCGTTVYQIQHVETGVRGGWMPSTHTAQGYPRLRCGAWLEPTAVLVDAATATASHITGDIVARGNTTIAFSTVAGAGMLTGDSYLYAADITLKGAYHDVFIEPFGDEDCGIAEYSHAILWRTCGNNYAIHSGGKLHTDFNPSTMPDAIYQQLRAWDH